MLYQAPSEFVTMLRMASPSLISMAWAGGVGALGYAVEPHAIVSALVAFGACGFGILIGIMVERERGGGT